MSKVEGRGPIDPPLCLCVTFFTLCLLGLTGFSVKCLTSLKDVSLSGTQRKEICLEWKENI